MKHFRRIISFLMVFAMLTSLIPSFLLSAGAESSLAEPEVSVDNFKVTVTNALGIRDMRYAEGRYTTVAEIKAAEGNVALSSAIVSANTRDGVFTYNMPNSGYYTLWIRMTDGTNYIKELDVTDITPYVTSYGVKVTLHNLDDIKDFFIAKGQYDSYADIKTNGYIFSATAAKIGTRHDYTYTVYEPGVHTVLIRYNDGSTKVFHETLVVDEPVFTENGLQVIISNIPDVKVIRTAYGTWSTTKELKATDTLRNFSAKTAIKGKDPYTVQYRTEGAVTIIVEYNNGYIRTYHYDVTRRQSTMTQEGNTVTFGNLDGLLMIRYAMGLYDNSADIKAAPDSIKIKPDMISDSVITVADLTPGTYTFCVQYDDESFNYYTVTVEEEIPTPPEATATSLHVSCAFSDNMILQRDEKLSVWGTADPNSGAVVVEIGDSWAAAEVDAQGNWKAVFDNTFSYTTVGQTITVRGGAGNTVVFNGVLFGDVYYVAGQSNAFYSMGELLLDLRLAGRSHEVNCDYSDARNIRFFRISSTDYMNITGPLAQGTTTLYNDVYNGGFWMKPSDIAAQILTYANFVPTSPLYNRDAISMEVFSALGYLFAYNMSLRSDVPVGVIEIDASGHPLITFAPNELADKWGHDVMGADGRYHYKLGVIENANLRTRYAYNQQIYPLSNFSIAGIIWYQGESDLSNTRELLGAGYNNTFADQFTELMTYFRNTFGNSDFPVYLVEFATCYSNNGLNAYMDFGSVRAEEGIIPQKLDNCYVASSSDLWFNTTWFNNVHPYIKHFNASRVVDIVLADKFGIGDLNDVCGPNLMDVEYVGDSWADLTFDHVGAGLTTSDDSGNVIGLEILIDLNGTPTWITHNGKIITGTNRISVNAGSFKLLGVRYGRATDSATPINRNLCNAYKMPAVAFVDYRVD